MSLLLKSCLKEYCKNQRFDIEESPNDSNLLQCECFADYGSEGASAAVYDRYIVKKGFFSNEMRKNLQFDFNHSDLFCIRGISIDLNKCSSRAVDLVTRKVKSKEYIDIIDERFRPDIKIAMTQDNQCVVFLTVILPEFMFIDESKNIDRVAVGSRIYTFGTQLFEIIYRVNSDLIRF